jgi:hypothetical protein
MAREVNYVADRGLGNAGACIAASGKAGYRFLVKGGDSSGRSLRHCHPKLAPISPMGRPRRDCAAASGHRAGGALTPARPSLRFAGLT